MVFIIQSWYSTQGKKLTATATQLHSCELHHVVDVLVSIPNSLPEPTQECLALLAVFIITLMLCVTEVMLLHASQSPKHDGLP